MTCNERFNICSISGGRGLSRSGWYTSRPFSRVMAYPVPPLITCPFNHGASAFLIVRQEHGLVCRLQHGQRDPHIVPFLQAHR